MSKLQRTNERCYICDFTKPVDDRGYAYHTGMSNKDVKSMYFDGLSSDLQEEGGRYVFIHPKDSKPICSDCFKTADHALRDFTAGEQVTWRDTNSRLFEKSLTVPADLYNSNIDWNNLEYNDNGTHRSARTYKFPLKLKYQPRQIGYQLCEKVPQVEITSELRAQVDTIRAAKGYLLSPEQEEERRLAYNASVEAFWASLEAKSRCPGTSDWPVQPATGDPSKARTEHVC